MEENTTRAEAERLLGIAEKLLQNRDLNGSRDFAILAQETEPLLDGSDQILAVVDVLLAAEKRINNYHDWYSILQLDRRYDDLDLIKRQYRRLALLLHPDKNKFPFSDAAFKLVADSWNVLSDPSKKSMYDNEFTRFAKVDLSAMRKQREYEQSLQNQNQNQHHQNQTFVNVNMNDPVQQNKLPVRRTAPAPATRSSNFWTACPYCYHLYEYPRVYEGCCLRCVNCQRAFHAAVVPSLPPLVQGKDEYYCCWGFFPMGFVASETAKNPGFPNWTPVTHRTTAVNGDVPAAGGGNGDDDGFVPVNVTPVSAARPVPPPPPARARPSVQAGTPGGTGKKRGRPRKNL
ncbi:hypothetical protein LguiB_017471 [Lonicera macranthoides]